MCTTMQEITEKLMEQDLVIVQLNNKIRELEEELKTTLTKLFVANAEIGKLEHKKKC